MSAITTTSRIPGSSESILSIRPVARTRALNTCQRCGGFLVDEHCMELDLAIEKNGQRDKFWAKRCVQCGDLIDETILRNR